MSTAWRNYDAIQHENEILAKVARDQEHRLAAAVAGLEVHRQLPLNATEIVQHQGRGNDPGRKPNDRKSSLIPLSAEDYEAMLPPRFETRSVERSGPGGQPQQTAQRADVILSVSGLGPERCQKLRIDEFLNSKSIREAKYTVKVVGWSDDAEYERDLLSLSKALIFLPFADEDYLAVNQQAATRFLTECQVALATIRGRKGNNSNIRLQRLACLAIQSDGVGRWYRLAEWALAPGAKADTQHSISLLSRSSIPCSEQLFTQTASSIILDVSDYVYCTLNYEVREGSPTPFPIDYVLEHLPRRIQNACDACCNPTSRATDVYICHRWQDRGVSKQIREELLALDPSCRDFHYFTRAEWYAEDNAQNERLGVNICHYCTEFQIRARIVVVIVSEHLVTRVQNTHLDFFLREIELAFDCDRRGLGQVFPIVLPNFAEAFKTFQLSDLASSVAMPTRSKLITSADETGYSLLPETQTATVGDIISHVCCAPYACPVRLETGKEETLVPEDARRAALTIIQQLEAWRRSASTMGRHVRNVSVSVQPGFDTVRPSPCRCHQSTAHDFFLSHRQASEGLQGNGFVLQMWRLLDSQMLPSHRKSTAFWDRKCINVGHQFQDEFVSAIRNTLVIVIILSDGSVNSIRDAHLHEDNVFLEWELALEAHRTRSAEIVMIRVGSGNEIFSLPSQCQDLYHNSPRSVALLPQRRTVRKTVSELFQLNFHSVTPDLESFEMWERAADICFQKLAAIQERRAWQ